MTNLSKSIESRLLDLSEQSKKINEELSQIQILVKEFPDLEMSKDRWGTVRYYAESANAVVNDFYTKHSCGCCNDAPLYAYPYLTVAGVKVHSKPDHFTIGEKNPWSYGETYDSQSVKSLREKNIAEVVCKRIELITSKPNEEIDDDLEQAE